MADDINKKITVDVQVNTDGQHQVDQYKASFDNLRGSINGLGKPIADIGNNLSALNKDIAKLSSSVEQYVTKITGSAQKASDQQAKINAASNQKLKTHLTEAQKMKEQATARDLQLNGGYYADLAKNESEYYNEQKAELDKLLKDKVVSQKDYNATAELMLKDHHANLLKIMEQFRADNGLRNGELTAKGTVNIPQSAPPSGTVQKAPDPAPDNKIKSTSKGIIGSIKNAFKKVFANVIGYYSDTQNSITKTAKDGALKTNSAVEETDKASQAKRLASAVDNAKKINDSISGIFTSGLDARTKQSIANLENQKNTELNNAGTVAADKQKITQKYQKLENAVNAKAFKEKQKISIAQAIINGAIAITKSEAELGPIAGTIAIAAIVAETAGQIATINSQRPIAMAKGGYFKSDGKGTVLPGYSRTDDTNAFLRSGEAVVVSEAMRDPWARNLVSAINVAYGGRDFSISNPAKGYAVGGIFTDGGNANRYYNQPVNDQKNLANTVAYQMINNFPPVYVDVKDINNQQNILAQTVNRVNL